MARRFLQYGIGLIELMISITLGLIIVAVVIQVYVSSKSTFRMQAALSGLQENGRLAASYLSQDIRMAGYMGCPFIDEFGSPSPKIPFAPVVAFPQADLSFDANNIIRGFDTVSGGTSIYGTAASAMNANGGVVTNTDVLVVREAMNQSYSLQTNMTTKSADITLSAPLSGINNGDYLVISDCQHADLFMLSSGSGTSTIKHTTPANSTANLSTSYQANSAQVYGFQIITYFVGYTNRTTAGGNPIYALFVRKSTGSRVTTDELIEGVRDMQLSFGLDTNADGYADSYVAASGVASWSQVVSVQVNLLLVSDDDNVVTTNGGVKQSLTFNGNAIPSDNRLRQVFTATVAIRNRAEHRF